MTDATMRSAEGKPVGDDTTVTRAVDAVAAALNDHMEQEGLTVRDVAALTGVSVGTVHAVRHGTTRLEARVLALLEKGLDISLWPAHT